MNAKIWTPIVSQKFNHIQVAEETHTLRSVWHLQFIAVRCILVLFVVPFDIDVQDLQPQLLFTYIALMGRVNLNIARPPC